MTPEEEMNVAAVKKLVDAWNSGDLERLSGMWAPEMVHHGRNEQVSEASETASEMQRFLAAFPDLTMKLEEVVPNEDMVCTRIQLTATHQGEYLGAAATGRRIECRLMGQLRFAEGQVVEHWGVADGVAVLVTLGLCPSEYLAVTA